MHEERGADAGPSMRAGPAYNGVAQLVCLLAFIITGGI